MAGTTNDDELLILSDDSDIGSEFVLEEQIIDDNKSNSNNGDIISFDSDLPSFDLSLSDSKDVEKTETLVLDDTNDSGDFMLSFNEEETKEDISLPIESETSSVEIVNEPVLDEEVFSLGQSDITENIPTVSTEPVKVENNDFFSQDLPSSSSDIASIGTMTDILDEAIAKFAKREDVIASSITSREEHIKSLKDQIASLESGVNTDNEEVARLNTEKQSIVKNRKALEKMKEAPATTK